MKLYATVSSERATKGQGGNEYLDIKILGVDKHEMARVYVTFTGDTPFMALYLDGGGVHEWARHLKTKGKQQKDKCVECDNKATLGDFCPKCAANIPL